MQYKALFDITFNVRESNVDDDDSAVMPSKMQLDSSLGTSIGFDTLLHCQPPRYSPKC